MSKKAEGKILAQGPARTRFLSIPADVAGDDRFPFEDGERVMVEIDDEEIRVSRVKKE